MRKGYLVIIALALSTVFTANAQVSINTDGSSPDSSAILDLKSTNKGFLLPRMTTVQISGIANPAAGLLVFNTDSSDFYGYSGTKWISIWNTGDTLADWYCGNQFTDSRDSKSYNTVQIGTQCWMQENLNIGIMINSSSSDDNQTNNDTIEKYCYNNSTSNCDTYGGLYQWDEMMQYVTTEGAQGICPEGWHIPTDDEFKTLEMQLGMSSSDANSTGWRGTDQSSKLAGNEPLWMDGNLDQDANFGTSGFNSLPGGYRLSDGSFSIITLFAAFRLSSEDGFNSWFRSQHYGNTMVYRSTTSKAGGYSVRCVKN